MTLSSRRLRRQPPLDTPAKTSRALLPEEEADSDDHDMASTIAAAAAAADSFRLAELSWMTSTSFPDTSSTRLVLLLSSVTLTMSPVMTLTPAACATKVTVATVMVPCV